MNRTYHIDGTQPQNGEVFVFGSNLSGLHVGGAAKVAFDQHGAEMGIACGPTGNSYAIPTVSVAMRGSLPLDDIRYAVENFKLYAAEYPEKQYFVTRIGCGIAGHRDEDIAPLFVDAPANCSLPDTWRPLLEPDGADDPNHVIDEDDGWSDRRYRGDFLDDCKAAEPDSIMGMMGSMKVLSDSILDRGDGKNKDAEREARCGGHYSMQARGHRW